MKSTMLTTLALLVAAGSVEASLRVRYCDPETAFPDSMKYWDEQGGNQWFNKVKSRIGWWDKIIEGAWTGWSPTDGFDKAGENELGEFPNPPYAKAEWSFWVDSILEQRSDMPFIQNARAALDGEGVWAHVFGDLQVPESGEWTFYASKTDIGLLAWLDLNGDGTIAKDGADAENPYLGSTELISGSTVEEGEAINAPVTVSPADFNKYTKKTVTLQAGKRYKFMAYQWDHSQICFAGLFWKKGGGTIVPVPASAFGTRKQMGAPSVKLIKIVDETGKEYTPALTPMMSTTICSKLTFHAEAENMLGKPPSFTWYLNDPDSTVKTTTVPTLEFTYPKAASFIIPSVSVKRDDWDSPKSSEVLLITIKACETGSIVAGGYSGSKGVVTRGNMLLVPTGGSSAVSAKVFNMAGSKVMDLATTRQGGNAVIDMESQVLPKGSYMLHVLQGNIKTHSLPILVK